jgi:hypothetical protein
LEVYIDKDDQQQGSNGDQYSQWYFFKHKQKAMLKIEGRAAAKRLQIIEATTAGHITDKKRTKSFRCDCQ